MYFDCGRKNKRMKKTDKQVPSTKTGLQATSRATIQRFNTDQMGADQMGS